jgi:sensor histidine kinase YesM
MRLVAACLPKPSVGRKSFDLYGLAATFEAMIETREPTVGTAREGIWRVIARELRAAPPKARRQLLMSFLAVDLGIAVVVWDILKSDAAEAERLASVFLTIFGVTFLVVAQVLHQVSQGAECNAFSMPRAQSHRYHRAQVGIPLLALIAVILMSIAVGMLLPSIPDDSLFGAVAIFILAYVIYAARFVHLTTRFLHQHAAEQIEAAAQAQAQAVEAQLTALQSQMNPHFLFNALNTVAALVRTNGRAAEATVEHLADVLRRTLDRSRSGTGTVAEEVDYLRAYLAIEQERFGDRLQVDWRIAPEVVHQPLPPLALQPLVENAIRHGIGPRLEGGSITIEAVRSNGHVELAVADNGIGFPARHQEGTGLGNLRQRLRTLYGARSDLRIESSINGSRVTMIIPASDS